MDSQWPIEEVMRDARVDLTATVDGVFAPEDWQKILERAHKQLEKRLTAEPALPIEEAWREVVRDFYGTRYWGFRPISKKAERALKPARPRNLGVRFIWITFQTMCITKIIVMVLGQKYARTLENQDFWILIAAIALIVANFGWFLWKSRDHRD